MSFLDRALVNLAILAIGGLFLGTPVFAQSGASLIYPQDWCDETPRPLYFTMDQLGISQPVLTSNPIYGYVEYFSMLTEGGIYIPECEQLIHTGFDFFQLTDFVSGELFSVTILLSDGGAVRHQISENGDGGALNPAWTLIGGDNNSGVKMVEWENPNTPWGTHGFRVIPGHPEDSYLSFSFEEGADAYQPSGFTGPGNNGVATTIIIRPPTVPPDGFFPDGGQLIYATGHFSGELPSTALRLHLENGNFRIRAEGGSTMGRVDTDWCPLSPGVANRVEVNHFYGLSGLEDLLTLNVEDCREVRANFVTSHPPAAEHRFGIMDAENTGIAFDFDLVEIETERYEPRLNPDLFDDFEQGSWNQQWTPFSPESLEVTSGAAHTGVHGLQIQQIPDELSILKRTLPRPVSDIACHLSLDGERRVFTQSGATPRGRILAARGGAGDLIRLWVRRLGTEYGLRAHSGSASTGWLPLAELPATLDLRWTDGILQLWIQGCGPNPTDCATGYRVESGTQEQITKVMFGDVAMNGDMDLLTLDNVLCVIGR